jgi:hypothetical protein
MFFGLPLLRSFRPAGLFYFFIVMAICLLQQFHSEAAESVMSNEVMTSNGATLKDENGDSPDWIELFNPDPAAVSLAGYGLSDSKSQPFKWVFRNASIQGHGFLLVYASGKNRQPGDVTPIQPDSLPGLKVWLAADAINTNDTTKIRKSGGTLFVKNWPDLSGHAEDAQQSSETLQPVLLPASPKLSGKPSLLFDGLNDLLLLPTVPGTNNFCVIAVMRATIGHEIDPESDAGVGGISGQHWLFGARHGGDFDGGAGVSVGTNGVSVYEHGSFYMPALAVLDSPIGNDFAVLSINYNNKQPSIAVQGSLARTGVPSPRRNVNAPIEIGSGVYGAFNGEIAEVIIFDRALSDQERRGVEEYLARKYSLHFSGAYHTNFSLDAAGERIFVTRPDGTRADEMPAVQIPRDISYGRQPDGSTNLVFFKQPTPGASNSTPGSSEFIPPVQFSIPGGFYTDSLELILTNPSPGAVIHYTFDGSAPTESSPTYSTSLPIRGRAGAPNTISTIPTGNGWQAPAGEVFKTTVVRARAFKQAALPSEIATHTYLIYPRQKYSLPVISLATDSKNFFDPNVGIYVTGNTPGGNYFQRGPAWEKPAHIEFFETNGVLAFAQDIGIKIHGNTSRQFPQKALGIDARYGSSRSAINYKLFPDRGQTIFENFILRQSGHDYYLTFLRDSLMHKLLEDLGVEIQDYRPAIVFLNGEYWGIHEIRETEDKYYLAEHGGVDPNNVDYVEGYAQANEGDLDDYNAMINFIAANDLRLASNYAHVQSLMEVDNYMIYKVAEIFTYRWDIGNHRLWRPRTPEGRWRWMQFDNDVGWGGFWSVAPAWNFNMLAYDLEPNGPWTQYEGNPGGNDHNNPTTTFLLRKLTESPVFKRDFLNRFADMLNSTYQLSRVTNMINQMAAVIAPEMPEHINRWRSIGSMSAWRANVQYLRDYAQKRPAIARQQLIQRFGLAGTANLTVSLSASNRGSVQVNSVKISNPPDQPWSGIYFRGNAITLTANPKPGFKFTGWQGLPGTETNSVTLLLNGDLAVSATFTPDTSSAPRFLNFHKTPSGIEFLAAGIAAASYSFETSNDLKSWTKVQDATSDETGEMKFEEETKDQNAFYRLVLD